MTEVEAIADVPDGAAALEAVLRTPTDLVVLDLSMPGPSGLVTLKALKQSSPRTAVVVLTRYRDHEFVRQALAAGADGYVLKQSSFSELRTAVRAVLRGERYLDSQLPGIDEDEHSLVTTPPVARARRVSQREISVLRRAAQGYSNKEIAEELDIAVKTVEVHKANAMQKLGLQDRPAMIRYASLQGWLFDD